MYGCCSILPSHQPLTRTVFFNSLSHSTPLSHSHGHGHGHDDHGHGHHGSEDNKWYEDDSVMDPHEPPATRANPCFVTPYIRAFEEDGVWVVERERDPTLEEEVRFRVMKLLTFFDHVDASKIRKDSRFMDLGLDSLDIVELQMAVEEEFGVQIPDDLAEVCTCTYRSHTRKEDLTVEKKLRKF